ncbi:prephenate dehydrogenase/arogenate dehydrogenase family protein [Candidatus Acetothermia bacterium]|nr:prephenate dehydrogenase/arogenate dehydrogenase family protein [Candidatus Acetothermia bacterium]
MKPARSKHFKCVGIVGVGLIGGSFGLAIKRFQPRIRVIGVDKDLKALRCAKARGAIDVASQDLNALIKTDLIILATPIRSILEILPALPILIRPDTMVTDTGSTKAEICRIAKRYLPAHFVGGHPMAGSEQQGIEGAHPLMFENALYVLTPMKKQQFQCAKLASFLGKLGAQTLFLDPELHDRLVAATSHLPQLISVALATVVAQKAKDSTLYRELAAGGFRDLTRIASSPFGIWKDIFTTNATSIDSVLGEFMGLLSQMRSALPKHTDEIGTNFLKAKKFRDALPRRSKGFLRALHRLAIVVPDRAGALAEITGAIAQKKISIKDIELLKVREYEAGTFHLYFATETDAKRAASALREGGYECNLLS